ncbi:hypothetical protein [uncultured Sphingomonas sp.]|uniref:hypothetical protein n=1 Tax=uncultured Sphingomonas sp. TaxID=158754 RepID=UPI0035C9EA2F
MFDKVRGEINSDPKLGRKMAIYGGIGALIAIPLPIVGPVIGAVIGTSIAYARRTKS